MKSFRRIYIELNNLCNLRCRFCPYPLVKQSFEQLNVDVIKNLLYDIKTKVDYRIIYFHNLNEPFLYKQLDEVLDFCDSEEINYGLTTNGLLLPNNIDQLSGRKINQLNISYQIIDENEHYARGIDYSVDDYRKNILISVRSLVENKFNGEIKIKLLSTDGESYFNMVHIDGIEKTQDFIQEVDKIYFGLTKNNLNSKQIETLIKVDLRKHCKVKIYQKVYVEVFPFLNWGNNFNKVYPAFFGLCDGIQGQILIRSNGDVTPCCYDFNSELLLGNIKQANLSEILANVKTSEMIKKLSSIICEFDCCRKCLGDRRLMTTLRREVQTIFRNSASDQYKMSDHFISLED